MHMMTGLDLEGGLEVRQIFAVRHGETLYQGTEFDLTSRGAAQMRDVAREIASARSSYSTGADLTVHIYSSPATRARNGAEIIRGHLKARKLPVTEDITYLQAVRHFDIRNPDVFHKKVREEEAKGRHLDDYYWADPFFEDPAYVEPRSEVAKRSRPFLAQLLRRRQHFTVVVTHFEVITPWLILFGFEPRIGYGEWVQLGVTKEEVIATLRGITKERRVEQLLPMLT